MKTSKTIVLSLLLFVFFQVFANDKKNINYIFFSNKDRIKDTVLQDKFSVIKNAYEQKKLDLALKKAFHFLDSLNEMDFELKLRTNFLIGNILYETLSYKDAIKYFRKNIDIITNNQLIIENNIEKNNNDVLYIENLLRLGSSYHKLKEQDTIGFYKDSTLFFYNKVIKFSELNPNILDSKAIAYSNLSALYIYDTLYSKAESYVNKAIEIHKLRKNKLDQAASLGNLASIYLVKEKYEKAKEICFRALELIKNDDSSKAVRFKASLYSNLSWAMYKMRDYKAYEFQEISFEIKDKLRDKEFRRIIKKINAENDVYAAKKNVRREEENKRLKDLQAFLIIGIIGLIIIISLAYTNKVKTLKQKNQALNFTQQELIKNQEIEKLKSESQTRILNATLDAKESERKEIAEALHDNVSALLSSAKMHLLATKKKFNGSTPLEIDKTQEILTDASHKIRDLSHNLASSVLLNLGLFFAVKDMADKFSNSALIIETEIGHLRRYNQNFEVKVYNIILEFLNNIIKHSKAEYAMIELKEENSILYLRVSDDGVGFDKTQIGAKDGLGINQIDARVQMMKGKFHIESSENNGATISIEIPIIEKEVFNVV